MTMTVIPPIDFTYGMLTSSNVAENDFPVWTVPAVRAIGDQVVYNHKVYKALMALTATTDVNPETGVSAATKWLLIGATNRWRMFDDKVGTLTTNPSLIEVVLKMGQTANSIALFNCKGSKVTVTVEDPAEGIVYTHVTPLVESVIVSWYDFFFAPFSEVTDLVLLDLPSYSQASIRIKIEASGTAQVGAVAIGSQQGIGVACYGSSIGILDFSKKEQDEFGNYQIVERGFSKFCDFDIDLDTDQVTRVQRILAKYRAKACVWIGYEDYESTIVYGYYKDFTLTLDGPEESSYNLRIEGLV